MNITFFNFFYLKKNVRYIVNNRKYIIPSISCGTIGMKPIKKQGKRKTKKIVKTCTNFTK